MKDWLDVFDGIRMSVEHSTDWEEGLKATIQKWEIIVEGQGLVPTGTQCGLCIVAENRDESCYECYEFLGLSYITISSCPPPDWTSEETLAFLKKRLLEVE